MATHPARRDGPAIAGLSKAKKWKAVETKVAQRGGAATKGK